MLGNECALGNELVGADQTLTDDFGTTIGGATAMSGIASRGIIALAAEDIFATLNGEDIYEGFSAGTAAPGGTGEIGEVGGEEAETRSVATVELDRTQESGAEDSSAAPEGEKPKFRAQAVEELLTEAGGAINDRAQTILRERAKSIDKDELLDISKSGGGGFSPEKQMVSTKMDQRAAARHRAMEKNFRVRFSLCEIYMEKVTDLLSNDRSHLAVKEVPRGTTTCSGNGGPTEKWSEFFVDGLSEHDAWESTDILGKIARAERKRRKVAATKYNEQSSRSHTVLTLTIETTYDDTGDDHAPTTTLPNGSLPTRVGRLVFVDLAGNERLDEGGSYIAEGSSINLSLFFLGECISKLSQRCQEQEVARIAAANRTTLRSTAGSAHQRDDEYWDYSSGRALARANGAEQSGSSTYIPYRDSKLTQILAVHLGQNSQTAILVCLHPGLDFEEQSLNSLRFAQKAAQVVSRVRPVYRSPEEELLVLYRNRIRKLEGDLEELAEQIKERRGGGAGGAGGQGTPSSQHGGAGGKQGVVASGSQETDKVVKILSTANANYKALVARYRQFAEDIDKRIQERKTGLVLSEDGKRAAERGDGGTMGAATQALVPLSSSAPSPAAPGTNRTTSSTGPPQPKLSDLGVIHSVSSKFSDFVSDFDNLRHRSSSMEKLASRAARAMVRGGTHPDLELAGPMPEGFLNFTFGGSSSSTASAAQTPGKNQASNMATIGGDIFLGAGGAGVLNTTPGGGSELPSEFGSAKRHRLASAASSEFGEENVVIKTLMKKIDNLEAQIANNSPSKMSTQSSVANSVTSVTAAQSEMKSQIFQLKSLNKYLGGEKDRLKGEVESRGAWWQED